MALGVKSGSTNVNISDLSGVFVDGATVSGFANEYLRVGFDRGDAMLTFMVPVLALTRSLVASFHCFTTGTFDVAGIASIDVIRATTTSEGDGKSISTILIPVSSNGGGVSSFGPVNSLVLASEYAFPVRNMNIRAIHTIK